MNWFGLTLVIIGVVYLIYSVLCRNKVTYYNRSTKMDIIKAKEFFMLQLYFSVINSAWLIIYGIVLAIYDKQGIYPILGVLMFYFINFLLKIVSKNKGYVNYR